MGLFKDKNKGKVKEELQKRFLSYPDLIYITSSCIQLSLDMYLNSFRKDIENIAKKYAINFNDNMISAIMTILNHCCLFTIPATIYDCFEDKNIANSYIKIWHEIDADDEKLKLYKYFQSIMDDNRINILGVLPIAIHKIIGNLNIEIIRDTKLHMISTRVISFTFDLVRAFCKNNPLIKAYIGDYIAEKTLTEPQE